MSPVKRYLLWFTIVYLALAGLGLLLFRSGELSEGYLQANGPLHERYVSITSDPQFVKFSQRPHLYPPGDPRHMQLQFVREYRERPDYKGERVRIELFTLYFHFLNGVMFLAIVVHFSRRPLLAFLDKRSDGIHKGIDHAAKERKRALHLRAEVEADVDAWPERETELRKRSNDAIEANLEQIREEARLAQIQLERETDDRKRAEALRAQAQMKEELVSAAVAQLEQMYRNEATERELRNNVDQFLRLLELIS